MNLKSFLLLFSILVLLQLKPDILAAQDTITFSGSRSYIGDKLHFIVDEKHELNFDQIFANKTFSEKKEKSGLNFGNDNAAIWSEFYIYNNSNTSSISVQIENPILDILEIQTSPDVASKITIDNTTEFSRRPNEISIPTFNLSIPPNTYQHVVVHVLSSEEQIIPIIIDRSTNALSTAFNREIIYALLAGVILVMFFYNLFIFFSTSDVSYLYYVVYILFIGFSQLCLGGFTYKYILSSHPHINKYGIVLFPAIAGNFAILFLKNFLRVNKYAPKLNKYLYAVMVIYTFAGVLRLCNFYQESSKVMDFIAVPSVLIVYVAGIKIYNQGFKSALYFLVAWSVFVLGLSLYVFRNFGLLEYSNLTNYTMPIGAAIEVGLLSFALADKINTLQKEKQEKEQEVIQSLQENERLITEQNIILEEKVTQRTSELNKANVQLNSALVNLKEAQIQLVENAKMASLGQLTAGIAHEINNPINFVKSNINPLKLDIKDIFEVLDEYNKLHKSNGTYTKQLADIKSLQDEIDISFVKNEVQNLLKGIEEGAERTAEIVHGLRIFSRLDESTFKKVNVHDGISSTLLLLKNSIPHYIKVKQIFEADGALECSPGELNQVFMNIINNAVQAITTKPVKNEEEYIYIETCDDVKENSISIKVKDSGIGMDKEVKERIFEPFFTTKDVGEGTGLGLAIVFKIIQKHKGRIEINTEIGTGSEFILHLPRNLKN